MDGKKGAGTRTSSHCLLLLLLLVPLLVCVPMARDLQLTVQPLLQFSRRLLLRFHVME